MLSVCSYFFQSVKSVCRLHRPGSSLCCIKSIHKSYYCPRSQTTSYSQTCQNLIFLIPRDTFHFCSYVFRKHTPPAYVPWAYLLVFHMWTTSGSVIFLLSAWASKKSKKYLMATGALLLGKLQMLLKSFSTTEWIATWKVTKLIFCYYYTRTGYFTSESCVCCETTTDRNYNMLVANIKATGYRQTRK